MKIGFIKFGLKTYFNKNGTGQGSNHELVDVFHIFEERGHECLMLSNTDYDDGKSDTTGLDIVFVFNGPLAPGYESKMNMFQGTMTSLRYLRDTKIPWAYFWTDPRKDYDIRNHQIYKDNPPIAILSQEKEFYAHLEKLVLYRQKPQDAPKDVFVGSLMNYTDPKRSKFLVNLMNSLDIYYGDRQLEIRGEWKKETHRLLKEPISENEVVKYLASIKYGLNIGKDPKWVSQKYYEWLLAGTICFFANYDEDNLIMKPDDFRRMKNDTDLVLKIQWLEERPEAYAQHVKDMQQDELLEEYFTGQFIYDTIIKKIT